MKRKNLIFLAACTMALTLSCQRPETPAPLSEECIYTPEESRFALWAADATQVRLRIYPQEGSDPRILAMKSRDGQHWSVRVPGDLKGAYYTFQTCTDGQWNAETPGIFAKAVSINGEKGAVIDWAETQPAQWSEDRRPPFTEASDAIVYELHLRDFTMDPGSGIVHKGKFLGLAERGTRSAEGYASGLDHLRELGVTHVQILPSFDYASVDETHLEQNVYNWGYDPQNYNVPEGSYSTDPADPVCRIREMKTAIQALHSAGIRVIMDVVYNHTYDAFGCALGQVSPGYFYRHQADGSLANGSGCGNETASEQPMMRQFMIESVSWWAREYHIDGFRFDLMGIHDQETLRQIRAALAEIDPSILVYGEGWAASAPAYPDSLLAMKAHMTRLPGVGAFSDDIRDALVGSPFTRDGGFASGFPDQTERLRFGLQAATVPTGSFAAWTAEPAQHISYVTCHDNYCLRDRLSLARPDASEAELLAMDKLAQSAILTAQGIPFLFAGEELFRTKGGEDNSFKSPDSVNAIRWQGKARYHDLFAYYQALIAIRKAHPGFRLRTAREIEEKVSFPSCNQEQVLIYRIGALEGIDEAASLTVIFNGSDKTASVEIPEGLYQVLAQNGKASAEGLGLLRSDHVSAAPYSATILAEIQL